MESHNFFNRAKEIQFNLGKVRENKFRPGTGLSGKCLGTRITKKNTETSRSNLPNIVLRVLSLSMPYPEMWLNLP